MMSLYSSLICSGFAEPPTGGSEITYMMYISKLFLLGIRTSHFVLCLRLWGDPWVQQIPDSYWAKSKMLQSDHSI